MTQPRPPGRPVETAPVALGEVVAGLADLDAAGGGTEVSGVTLSSARVLPGDLYAALPGARTHGARYAADAVGRGAVAVLTDPAGVDLLDAAAHDVPVATAADPRAVLGELAARVYDHPADALTVVAVTGTQGKTTSTYLAESALAAAGEVVGVVGTTGTRVAGEAVPSALTTPEAPDLHALLAVMRERGATTCAMEVSSHALVLGRVDGVVADVAVFLNLGRDHLDFHRDVDDYFAAKATLFTPRRSRRGVVVVDDDHGRRLAAEAQVPVTTVSIAHDDADWTVHDLRPWGSGTEAEVRGPGGVATTLRVPLPGEFNVGNALAVVAALAEVGHDPEVMVRGIERSPGVPGRMQAIDHGQPFRVVVDYAHKPDAVDAVLRSLRSGTTGRLVVVLGAGGDRDRGKRPVMGAIAAGLADAVVVTDDNPRTEEPAAIRAEVLAGARDAVDRGAVASVTEDGDRASAIVDAISQARPGDTVVVAGKGHETGQEVHGVVHPFDDVVEVRRALTTAGWPLREPVRPTDGGGPR